MVALNQLKKSVNDSFSVAQKIFGAQTNNQLENSKFKLLAHLDAGKYIKVPFVGDFSAGKSSLINAMIGKEELFPTDINPLTAVSYELYYDTNERLELWRNDKKVSTHTISEIKHINVVPGDIVKTFLQNEQIKKWNDKGLVIVDMPVLIQELKSITMLL